MFDNLFSPSPWVWLGLVSGLASLPVLIHLINLLRHQRVQWAAMEFLLQSHKKHRNWIRLKQWLLLLSRICILLIILFALAQVGCNNEGLSRVLGGAPVHHYVLVDDSFSMSDTDTGVSVMDRARQTFKQIAARAKDRSGHRFTVLRFSKCKPEMHIKTSLTEQNEAAETPADSSPLDSSTPSPANFDRVADINSLVVDSSFDQTIESLQSALVPSMLAVSPQETLRIVDQLIESRPTEHSHVYLLSDFRAKDWSQAPDLISQLKRIRERGAQLELINCVESAHANLAITSLAALGNVRVAGIPVMMSIQIKNYGKATARSVRIELVASEYDLNAGPDSDSRLVELPTVLIDEIKPGETQSRRFAAFFSSPGQHHVRAKLQADSLMADNSHWSVISIQSACRVLLVATDSQLDARFVETAIGPHRMTGIESEVRDKDFLRDVSPEELARFDTIFMLDVDRLDDSAVRNLREYTAAGGGVAFFLGPQVNLQHYNDVLWDKGQGLLPLPLDKSVESPEQIGKTLPDIDAQPHPIFDPLLSAKHSPLDLVQVKRYFQPPGAWFLEDHQATILALVRGDETSPLMIEKAFGRGNVLVTMTTAGPRWNNWARNGTFPVVLLLMQNHLSRGRYEQAQHLVGQSWNYQLAIEAYDSEVTFVAPTQDPNARESWTQEASTLPGSGFRDVQIRPSATNWPGVYEAWLPAKQASEVDRRALNIDSIESDLTLADRADLRQSLADADARLVDWDRFQPETSRSSSTSLSKLLLVVLLVLLFCEQLLALSASYHPVQPRLKAAT